MAAEQKTRTILLKIDLGGTRGNEAWDALEHFAEIGEKGFGHPHGSSGPCRHPDDAPHPAGEWRGGFVKVERFLAEYALPHYLRQPRVIDAEIEPD